MTRKQVRNAMRRYLGPDSELRYRVRAARVNGRCTVVVTRRPGVSWERPERMLVASAKTWAEAGRQHGMAVPV